MKNIFSTSLIALSLLLVSVNSNATETAPEPTKKEEIVVDEINNPSNEGKCSLDLNVDGTSRELLHIDYKYSINPKIRNWILSKRRDLAKKSKGIQAKL